jgi:hypothetical protein
MSHYTVLVVGDNIEEQLWPFWELDLNEEEMKMDPRSVFISQIKDSEKEEKFQEFLNKEKDYLEKNNIKYESATDWMIDWHGYKYNGELQSWGYYKNPQQKWDWYSVGGRWSGFFLLKNGATGKLGMPGIYGREEENELPNRADQAKKGDIDWEGMRQNQIENSKKLWQKVVVEGKDKYQPDELNFLYGITPEDTIETFVEKRSKFPATFAVLKDGNWYEKGKMGWWGITTDEKPDSEWENEFQKLIEDLPDDTLLTVVDCHI